MTSYHATVTRENGVWVGVIDEPIGQQAMEYETLPELRQFLPAFVADMTSTAEIAVELSYRYVVNGVDVTAQLNEFAVAEAGLREKQAGYESARLTAVQALTEAGLSRRGTADAVGLSHQRVQQLLDAS